MASLKPAVDAHMTSLLACARPALVANSARHERPYAPAPENPGVPIRRAFNDPVADTVADPRRERLDRAYDRLAYTIRAATASIDLAREELELALKPYE